MAYTSPELRRECVPIPDVAPPQPVMRNVGAEAFMEGLGIAINAASAYGSITGG